MTRAATYRRIADNYRRWLVCYVIGTVLMLIAATACLLLQHVALTIGFSCTAMLFTFIAATLRQDQAIFRDLADYYEDIEADTDEP